MQPDDWQMITEEVESLWGRSAKWAKADRAFKFARSVPVEAARSAIESLFMRGGAAPYPADVLSHARDFIEGGATKEEWQRFCELQGHAYAIVEEQAGIRTGICARCGDNREVAAHLMPTQGELDDGTYTGRPDPVFDERIAP